MKCVIFVSSLSNPFVDAWYDSISTFSNCAVVVSRPVDENSLGVPARIRDVTVQLGTGPTEREAYDKVEHLLGGPPEVVFYWWGFHALSDARPMRRWPSAHLSLCVDTFPNAAVLTTEIREHLSIRVRRRTIDSLVVTSPQMRELILRRHPMFSHLPIVTVLSPFPAKSHASVSDELGGTTSDTLKICFTGRSDYLYHSSTRMAKDNLAPVLEAYLDLGVQIWVQETSDQILNRSLRSKGYRFYPKYQRGQMTNGDFADALAGFDGHLVSYAITNSTLARRVSTGLSTRFAVGLTAPSPLIVPREATFARDFLSKAAVGSTEWEPNRVLEDLRKNGLAMRRNWSENHLKWSGENQVGELRRVWGG